MANLSVHPDASAEVKAAGVAAWHEQNQREFRDYSGPAVAGIALVSEARRRGGWPLALLVALGVGITLATVACTRSRSLDLLPTPEYLPTPHPTEKPTSTATATATQDVIAPAHCEAEAISAVDDILPYNLAGETVGDGHDWRDAANTVPAVDGVDADGDGDIDQFDTHPMVDRLSCWARESIGAYQKGVLQDQHLTTIEKLVELTGQKIGEVTADEVDLDWMNWREHASLHSRLLTHDGVVVLSPAENVSESLWHIAEGIAQAVGLIAGVDESSIRTVAEIYSGLIPHFGLEGWWKSGVDPKSVDELRTCLTWRPNASTRLGQPESVAQANWQDELKIGQERVGGGGEWQLSNDDTLGVAVRLVEVGELPEVMKALHDQGHRAEVVTVTSDGRYVAMAMGFDFSNRGPNSEVVYEASDSDHGSGDQLIPCAPAAAKPSETPTPTATWEATLAPAPTLEATSLAPPPPVEEEQPPRERETQAPPERPPRATENPEPTPQDPEPTQEPQPIDVGTPVGPAPIEDTPAPEIIVEPPSNPTPDLNQSPLAP